MQFSKTAAAAGFNDFGQDSNLTPSSRTQQTMTLYRDQVPARRLTSPPLAGAAAAAN